MHTFSSMQKAAPEYFGVDSFVWSWKMFRVTMPYRSRSDDDLLWSKQRCNLALRQPIN